MFAGGPGELLMSTLSDWTNVIEQISAKNEAERRKRVYAFRRQTDEKDFSKESDEDLLELFVRATNGVGCFHIDERNVWEIAHGKIRDELMRRLRKKIVCVVMGNDYPDAVFEDPTDAEAYCVKERAASIEHLRQQYGSQYLDTNCATCQVCASPRVGGTIIGFPAHGSRKRSMDSVVGSYIWTRSFLRSSPTSVRILQ
jgi:hypothetical protein